MNSKIKKKIQGNDTHTNLRMPEMFVRRLRNNNPSVIAEVKMQVFAKVIKNLSTNGDAAKKAYPAAIKTKELRQ